MKEILIYRAKGVIDIEEIKIFEAKMLKIFPNLYVNLISRYNALRPINSDFEFKHVLTKKKIVRDISFFGFGKEIPDYDQIDRVFNLSEYGSNDVIIFGHSANGDFICFDYREDITSSDPKIVLMFHDQYGDDNKMLINPVANSFDEFIDMLYEDKDKI